LDFSKQITRGTHRRNCVALKDASVCTLVGRKCFSLQPAYIPTSIPIPTLLYTRLSSRNSAVHFYYLPFYGRKSLPHADSRCAEGRRAIARKGEGSFSKNEPHTHGSLVSPRRRGRYAYVLLILTSCTRRESSPLVKRKYGRCIICNILRECDLSSL